MAATDKHLLCLLLGSVLLAPSEQQEGQVALFGTSLRCEGRVEIYHNGKWGTVCDDDWGLEDGHVVCRQLGCGFALKVTEKAVFGEGEGSIWLDNVACSGRESSLNQCPHNGFGVNNCGHGEDAGVFCSAAYIRLVSPGPSLCSGRVEVFHDGWGTVCDDGWDLSDAKVVCGEVDCGPPVLASTAAAFGQGSGSIWLDNVRCSGSESSFRQCSHDGFGTHDCSHREDAGVICSDKIRLVGPGSSRCAGRVEVYHKGVWGTVCDDSWDLEDAKVVCKQLGCGAAVKATTEAFYGQGSGQIWLDDVRCVAAVDKSITECWHNGFGVSNCGHHEDAGVICS